MGSIRTRKETNRLYFDFRYQGQRCREQTELEDTPANRRRMQSVLDRIEVDIRRGVFDYAGYFPNSPNVAVVDAYQPSAAQPTRPDTPKFADFSQVWLAENEVRWRRSTRQSMKELVALHLVPRFGSQRVSAIAKADLLAFRAELSKRPGRSRDGLLSPKTVNDVIGTAKSILAEAADRYAFPDPGQRVGRLKVPRQDIQPFTLDEVWRLIETVRIDYRPYLTIRFFTGMRTGEINGLKWDKVDFARRQILVRETFTKGEQDGTKTDGSQREIQMSEVVYEAFRSQREFKSPGCDYVFSSPQGQPIDVHNFTQRVWNPLLRHLGLAPRRSYQTRHTCATLWLAAGENPEWIARQLGHSTTEMLFRVYSRFVPNLTRNDGSAFERMLAAQQPRKKPTHEK